MESSYKFNGEEFILCKFQNVLFWGKLSLNKKYVMLYQFKDIETAPSIFFNWVYIENCFLEILH